MYRLLRKRAALLLSVFLFLPSCTKQQTYEAPRSVSSAGPVSVLQDGPAEVPASASSSTTDTEVPLPASSVIEVSFPEAGSPEPPALKITVSDATLLRTKTVNATASGAKAYTPPAPPSAVEQAQASGVKWFYAIGALSAVVAIFSFAKGFPYIGITTALGAAGAPLLGNFASHEAVLRLLIGVGTAASAFWLAWRKLKPAVEKSPVP